MSVRRRADRVEIELRGGSGPAAEPRLGRMLHAAIRPGDAEVLLDLRHLEAGSVGAGALLGLVRSLVAQRELALRVLWPDTRPEPGPPM